MYVDWRPPIQQRALTLVRVGRLVLNYKDTNYSTPGAQSLQCESFYDIPSTPLLRAYRAELYRPRHFLGFRAGSFSFVTDQERAKPCVS